MMISVIKYKSKALFFYHVNEYNFISDILDRFLIKRIAQLLCYVNYYSFAAYEALWWDDRSWEAV